MKQCRKCKETKQLTEFRIHKRNGRPDSWCKLCEAATTKLWNKNNPKGDMVIAARNRAKVKGLIFNINKDDFEIPEYCPVLNIKLIKGKKQMTDASPSLDRTDTTKGYIKGNVQVMSYKANRMKSDATKEQLQAFARYILNGETK